MAQIRYAIEQDAQLRDAKFSGTAHASGGHHPRVPLHNHPLLAWMHAGHPVHGADVFTEDQKASVADIAKAAAETPSIDALAERFGTTREHVVQALDYAVSSGYLST